MDPAELWKAWLPKREPWEEGFTRISEVDNDTVNQLALQAFESDADTTTMVMVRPDGDEELSIEEWGSGPLMATLHMAMAFAMARGAKEHCNHHGPPKRLAIRISVVAEDD